MHNPHYALIVLQIPEESDLAATGRWQSLVSNGGLPKPKTQGSEQLGQAVWLLHIDQSMQAFGSLMAGAEKWGVPYRVLFFEDAPDWIGSWKSDLTDKSDDAGS